MESIFLCRFPGRSRRLSRFLTERFTDFVNGATPHNHDVFLGTNLQIEPGLVPSVDSNEQQQFHRQRWG
jgi:hypothetical protein